MSLRLVVYLIIASLAVTFSPVQAEVAGVYAREAMRSAFALSADVLNNRTNAKAQDFATERVDDPSLNADRVTHFRLCPRRLTLYIGEAFTLVGLPLDSNQDVVHGVASRWGTNAPAVATVSSWGEVEAIGAGHAVVTVEAGTGRASVVVEVREGARPVQRDLEWDLEHAGDCTEPESVSSQPVGSKADLKAVTGDRAQTSVDDGASGGGRFQSDSDSASGISDRTSNPPTQALGTEQSSSRVNASGPNTLKRLARPAVLHTMRSLNNRAIKAASHKIPLGKVFPVIDPDGGDTTSPDAAKFNNAVGSPRFTAQDVSPMGSSKTRRQLGSYNYTFTAPVLGLGGRGTGVGLALSYNSRLWNKDGSTMTFNYNKGWPAAGWTLGYGRIIKNYDNTATGDGTGVGQFNRPGNRLLIQPDGTRTHLEQVYSSLDGTWDWDTIDGTFYHLSRNGKLKGPDGSVVKYDEPNNRLVPTSIKNRNGELITIAYRIKDANFPYRWAIDFISDSLGRVIQFKYYGDSGYPADPANGKPDDALAAILAPNFGGSGTRTLVQIDYQDITLKYDFGSMTVVSPGNNSILTVVRRIYYPQTGTGYLFQDYSTYGMPRKISTRKARSNVVSVGYIQRETETDWGTQFLIGAGIGAAVKGLAGVGGAAAGRGSSSRPAAIGQLPATRSLAGELETVAESLTGKWTPDANAKWIESIIQRRLPVFLSSPPTPENLEFAGRLTQFGIEYNRLLEAGYYRWGGFLLPH